MFSIDKEKYPNCYSGHQYALDVVSGKIPNCKFVVGACNRYLKDIKRGYFKFDLDKAERYLRTTQLFSHVKGKNWKSENITYEPWQNFVFMNIMGFIDPRTNERRFRSAHIEIPRGQGKALCLETDVPTPKGLIKFKEINIGDEVYGSDGKVCKVVNKNEIHYPKAYRITFSDNTVVDCSSEHLWVTSDKSERDRKDRHKIKPPKRLDKNGNIVGNISYKSVKNTEEIFKTLKYGKENNHCVENCSPVEGTRDDCQLGYILGYWLGDGHSATGSFVAHKDQFEEIKSRFESQRVTVKIKNERGNAIHFICSGLTFWLRELNLINNKHIPEKYFMASESVRREVLRGLMDSDGTISKSGAMSFTNTNKRLIKDFRRLLASLGYRSSLTTRKTTAQNGFKGTAQKVEFSVPYTRPRIFGIKKKEQRRVDRPAWYSKNRYIVNVEEIESKPMFCIQVDSPDNTFLITDQYIPTHNSLLASQMVLYFLALDNPKGNEISCASTKTDQARIVLDSARAMAKENKKYLKATGVEVLAHKIVHEKSNSFVRALSSDSKSLDGLNDILCVMDELHAVDRSLFEVIESGMKKRNDSLLLAITTAGSNTDGIGYSQSQYAKKISIGEVDNDQFFSIIYTIDDGDDIFSPASWKKANPNFGVSVDPIAFESTARKAMVTPSDIPNFKTKNLNVWISEANAFFDMKKWDACADPSIKIENFYNKTCFVGLDLASKVDLTAKVKVFKENGIYYIFQDAYLPEDTVNKEHSALYDNTREKELKVTPGEAINYEFIEKEILADAKKFRIDSVHYDPWSGTQIAQNLMKNRINMVEFKMNTANFSEPMKSLDALIRQGKIRHNGGELLRYCMANVVAKEDHNQNVFPRKSSDKLKIDLAISLIMAIAGWLVKQETASVYESRGIRTI